MVAVAMTVTDHTQTMKLADNGPVIILVHPQMGENIGAAARAMLNCGLGELRLVKPRDGWPNERAEAMSSGALGKMPPVQVFETTAEAMADCHYVYATTARPRDMVKPVLTPRATATDIAARIRGGQRTAILFGAERTGLNNDDIALAQAIVTIPLNPGFSSLNLGQAVLLLAYEFSQAGDDTPAIQNPTGDSFPAPHDKLKELYDRLEHELAAHHFFRSEDMRPTIVRNLQNMLGRAHMTDQEVRTFHGVISALTGRKTARPGQ